MTLEEYLKANTSATLEEVQAYTELGSKMISPDMLVAMLTNFGDIQTATNGTTNESIGLNKALQFGSEFNLINGHPASVKEMLDKMVLDNLVSKPFVDYAVSYANPTVYPFADVTELRYNQAKGIYTEVSVSNYVRGKNIKITLSSNVPEKCAITSWSHEADFGYENLGKLCHINTTDLVYKLKLDNIAVDGTLCLRLPFNIAFACELI